MDRHHKNQKLNIDDMADLSLDEILSDFNLDKLGFGKDSKRRGTAELDFAVPKFAFDEEDSDMKLYAPYVEELPAEDAYESYSEEESFGQFYEDEQLYEGEQVYEGVQEDHAYEQARYEELSWDEGDYGYEAREEAFQSEYLPEEEAFVPAVESFDFEDDFYGDDGYAQKAEDEYIIEDKPKRSSGSRPGFFNIFKKRSSGSIGAMEDEARSLAMSLKKEKPAKKAQKKQEEDFDLYMHLDELADINAREAEGEDYYDSLPAQEEYYDSLPVEEEYYSEDSIVEEFSEPVEEYAGEAFAGEYTEEDFRAEFDDIPDFEDEDNYYEEPEHYHSDSGSYEYGLDMGMDADPTSYAREDKRYRYAPVIDD